MRRVPNFLPISLQNILRCNQPTLPKREITVTHQYSLRGKHIVIDTNAGAIHQVDALAFAVIQAPSGQSAEEIAASLSAPLEDVLAIQNDIEALKQMGQLFTQDDPFAHIAATVKQSGVVKALCLHLAHTCNLSCAYCFAKEGTYNGKHALMTYETGKQALDFLVSASGDRTYLEVDFFGGEPLLNWDVLTQLVSYGRSLEKQHNKRFRFTLTTNGMLLDDDKFPLINREMETVVLSLDGRKETHDRHRKTPDGCGSYDIVVPKFQRLVASRNGQGYYIRGTYTRHNLDFTEDILHIADLGFREISMEPAVGPLEDLFAIRTADLPAVCNEYERLAAEMHRRNQLGIGFSFYHYTLNLNNAPCVSKRLLGCGVGTEYLAVTPDGDLFPCHQFAGDDAQKLGTVTTGITHPKVTEHFTGRSVYTLSDCTACWAKHFCGGGCAANAYHATGRVRGIDAIGCAMFKKRLECAIWLQANE